VDDRAEAWLRRRTSHWRDWPADRLLEWKQEQGARVRVVIPARDEQDTAGDVAGAVRGELVAGMPLVGEFVVMDSELMLVAERRRFGAELPGEPDLTQFARVGEGTVGTHSRAVPSAERPPAGTMRLGAGR
jgi:hypothetical protein